ncbi:MAG: hypothetical protein ACHQK8_02510, partial [Bacteroidia bacterium]
MTLITVLSYSFASAQHLYKLGTSARLTKQYFLILAKDKLFKTDSIHDTVFRVVHVLNEKNKKVFSQKIILSNDRLRDTLNYKILETVIYDTSEIKKFEDRASGNFFKIILVNSSDINSLTPVEDEINVKQKSKSTIQSKNIFSIKGRITATGQLSDNTYLYQSVPQNYVRTQVDAQVYLFGLPFNTSYYYTTENNSYLNKINNFRLSFDYPLFYQRLKDSLDKKIKLEKEKELQQLSSYDQLKLSKDYEKTFSKYKDSLNPKFKPDKEREFAQLSKYNVNDLNKEYGSISS